MEGVDCTEETSRLCVNTFDAPEGGVGLDWRAVGVTGTAVAAEGVLDEPLGELVVICGVSLLFSAGAAGAGVTAEEGAAIFSSLTSVFEGGGGAGVCSLVSLSLLSLCR